MLNLKKTAVAVLALGSSAVFAGTMGPVCAPGNVTVPCERTAWDVGAQALYLQPVSTGSRIVPAYTGGANATVDGQTWGSPFTAYQNLNPKYQWGFQVEGSYHFGMGNDLTVNWYRVSNTNNYTAYYQTVNPDPSQGAPAVVNPVRDMSVSLSPEWNQVNVELGQHVDFTDMKFIRLHGGVQYSNVKAKYQGTVSTLALSGTDKSTYNGFGPRGGVDATYMVGNGFSVYGKGAGALLIGPQSSSLALVQDGTQIAGNTQSSTALVPELEGKLGVKYDYAMAQGDLTLDVGWMWVNYFNALAQNTGGIPTIGGYRAGVEGSNFGLQGLYFGGKWTGNV